MDRKLQRRRFWSGYDQGFFRTGRFLGLAGEHTHTDTVVIRFPDMKAIDRWYSSPAYQALIPLRTTAAKMVMAQRILATICIILCTIFVPPATASKRFVDNGDGTISDTETGLMWAEQDNGVPINWSDALAYCSQYHAGGYTDWRMPTLTELASLFDRNEINRKGYHIIELISTTAQSCWASETRGNEAGRFNFTYGNVYWLRQSYSGPTRILPVRTEE